MGIVVRQSIKGTIMNYIGVAIGFITTFFVMTKYLTQEEIGLTRVMADAALLLSGLAALGTNTSAMRYYPYFKDKESRDHGFFGWTLIVPAIGFVIFTILFFVFKGFIINKFSDESPLFVNYMYLVIPMAFFMMYMTVFETNANLLMRIVIPKFVREVGVRLLTLVDYILYITGVISLDGMVIGLCLVYIVATLLNIIYLLSLSKISFKIEPGHVTPRLRRDFTYYTIFLTVAAVVGNIIPSLNTFFISAKMGLAVTGIYTIAAYMANLVEMPYRSLSAISRPIISQAMKDNDTQRAAMMCKSVSLHQLIAGALVFFIVWINIDLFFELLPNGEQYVDGKWVFFLLGLAKLVNSSMNIGVTVLSYSRWYYLQLIFTAILTVSAIILNNRLIPIWGMTGAAWSSIISFSIYYLFLLALVLWKTKISPFSWKEIVVIMVIGLLFVINWLSIRYASMWFFRLLGDGIVVKVAEAVLRTGIIVVIGLIIIYYTKISKEINEIINRLCKVERKI
ncbi:MAG: oligosaccharide flippase family protein [Bacteroidales bacterium]|nr:oligosaccharide flippase family protein [Bacteroidales bacterium]